MKNILTKDDIQIININLTNFCNMNCVLCKNLCTEKQTKIQYVRPLDDIIKQLEEFKNLNTIFIMGYNTEPMLYPYIFQFIKYAKSRNLIIKLSTNAQIESSMFLYLKNTLTEKDEVYFTICGNTQRTHEHYRRGSNLSTLIKNLIQFKSNKRNDILNYLVFRYNEYEKECIYRYCASNYIKSYTSAIVERFDVFDKFLDFSLPEKLSNCYIEHMQYNLTNNIKIQCKSLLYKTIYIDVYGNIFPCAFAYFANNKFTANVFDYSLINKYQYKYCYECEHNISLFMNKNNIAMTQDTV